MKRKLGFVILAVIGLPLYADSLGETLENAGRITDTSHVEQPIAVQTVRGYLGGNDPLVHARGQLRAGYITFSQEGALQTSAYSLAGHYDFNTRRWNGLMVGAEAYAVLNLGTRQKNANLNNDFFDLDGESFILFSQAYLDGKWGNTEIKLGRQSLNTPHTDSDDLRMMPNYFEAYTVTNTDIDDLMLSAGFIQRMAGWENAVNSPKFANVAEVLGASQNVDGVYYASAAYEGMEDLSLSLWYYHYSDIANVLYAEAGYKYTLSADTFMIFGLQYDGSQDTGASLLGKQDSQTFGITLETKFTALGLTVLAAYNQDTGATGAMGLSMGGGPFFTSMEDQTLDVVGSAGSAWIIGAGYDLGKHGVSGLNFGLAYGSFRAEDDSVYLSKEINAVVEYSFSDKIEATAAFASVDFKTSGMKDYTQFRTIVNYNF